MDDRQRSRTRALLDAFDLHEYVREARTQGRSRLATSAIRRRGGALYEQIAELRTVDDDGGEGFDHLVDFASRVLFPEWYLLHHDVPRYRSYTNIDVLGWFLADACPERCRTAIAVLLDDFIAFERRALAAGATQQSISFDDERVAKRLARLEDLRARVADGTAAGVHLTPPSSWNAFIAAPELALVHLTAFPQTLEHDEYAFLRTVHIAEVCFAAVLARGQAAVASLQRRDVGQAARHVGDAVPFAALLTPLLQTLKTTMRPEHFARFREATGNASAVQSRNYQLMQITLFGPDAGTMRALAEIDEMRDLLRYDDPAAPNLARLATDAIADGASAAGELSAQVGALDKELLKWRTLHKGIGRTHLPPAAEKGTGGTSGVSYLRRSLDQTLTRPAQTDRAAA